MGMTMTQKILAAHAGLQSVRSGELIEAKLDLKSVRKFSLCHHVKEKIYKYPYACSYL